MSVRGRELARPSGCAGYGISVGPHGTRSTCSTDMVAATASAKSPFCGDTCRSAVVAHPPAMTRPPQPLAVPNLGFDVPHACCRPKRGRFTEGEPGQPDHSVQGTGRHISVGVRVAHQKCLHPPDARRHISFTGSCNPFHIWRVRVYMHTYALDIQAQSGQLVPQPVLPDLAKPRVRAFRARAHGPGQLIPARLCPGGSATGRPPGPHLNFRPHTGQRPQVTAAVHQLGLCRSRSAELSGQEHRCHRGADCVRCARAPFRGLPPVER